MAINFKYYRQRSISPNRVGQGMIDLVPAVANISKIIALGIICNLYHIIVKKYVLKYVQRAVCCILTYVIIWKLKTYNSCTLFIIFCCFSLVIHLLVTLRQQARTQEAEIKKQLLHFCIFRRTKTATSNDLMTG